MSLFIRSFVLSGAAMALLVVAPVQAQYRPLPIDPAPAYAGLSAVNTGLAVPVAGYCPPPVGGYGYYNPYGNPYGGFLSGAADLVNAQGQYQNQAQQARITQNQANSGQLDVRRKQWEQEEWERARTPTVETMRTYEMQKTLEMVKRNPPTSVIWSGEALNVLMDDVQRMQRMNLSGPSIPVNPTTLKQIGVTSGTSNGLIAMFLNDGKIQWPFAMTRPEFDKTRNKMSDLSLKLYSQASKDGTIDPTLIREMLTTVKQLRSDMQAIQTPMSPSDTIAIKRFINQLELATQALEDPTAANYFNGTWVAKGSTVGEVIEGLTGQGLKFAPAADGNEAAYRVFYGQLLSFDNGLSRMAGGR